MQYPNLIFLLKIYSFYINISLIDEVNRVFKLILSKEYK